MVWKLVRTWENGESTFYVVPISWVYIYEEQKFVYYPPPGYFKDITKAIISQQEPNADMWKDYPVEVLPNDFATFIGAKKVEAEAVKMSQSEWEQSLKGGYQPKEYGTGKRNIGKKPRKVKLPGESTTELDSASISSEDVDYIPSPPKKSKKGNPEEVDEVKRALHFGSLPSTSRAQQNIYESPTKKKNKSANTQSPKKSAVNNPVKVNSPYKKASPVKSPKKLPPKSTNNDEESDEVVTKEGEFDWQAEIAVEVEENIIHNDAELAAALNCVSENKANGDPKSAKGKKKMPAVEEFLYFIAKKLCAIEKKVDYLMQKNVNPEGQLKFLLPCHDSKRLLVVENILQTDKTQFDILINVLASKPNSAARVGTVVNVILRYLMLDKAARNFCLNGSKKKYTFKTMKMCQAVVEAATRVKGQSSGVKVIEDSIGSWLNQAKKRMKYRNEKKAGAKKSTKKAAPYLVEEIITSQSEDIDSN